MPLCRDCNKEKKEDNKNSERIWHGTGKHSERGCKTPIPNRWNKAKEKKKKEIVVKLKTER